MRCALILLLAFVHAARAAEHPGNVFVAGEEVEVSVPGGWSRWRAVDVEDNEVGRGAAGESVARLGQLPIGYFELRERDGAGRVTVAVVHENNPAENTPIALDAAVSWFYPQAEQIRDACTLCRLAGVRWVRDRLSWPELETADDQWADETRYERAMQIQREMGLKVLQVNHASPAWATSNPSRFPDDLRLVYDFYRGLAKRWTGKVDAIEPWNEPDIKLFGGHTGCEIASFQKAAYLGLKAGDPELPACQSCFAIDRAETLDEFEANDVYPYFERYDLHHYTPMTAYPRVYGRHRALSGGRPMWTTEFNLPVHWADEQTHEPSDEELRVQAFRVGKVFATALHEGTEKAFYFILGHYVERDIQYGLVHTDLTPRPAYVAMAAVGRLLNAAKPKGRVELGDPKLMAYAFKTVVDGADRETVVAWSETFKTPVEFPTAEKAYDYLGRELPEATDATLSRETVYFVLPPGGTEALSIESPPAPARWRSGDACPVVLQLIGAGDVTQSAFALDESRKLRLVAYNFGADAAEAELSLNGATGGPSQLELKPGERKEWTLNARGPGMVTARAALANGGESIVAANVFLQSAADGAE